jgi:uncharacterized protein (DUF608 family)
MDENKKPVPFHKSIVEAIKEADEIDMACLANLIVYRRTAIPADHDIIKAAWEKRVKLLGAVPVTYDVSGYLEAEKQRCEDGVRMLGHA